MGANSSSFSELTTNPFLQRFVGKEVVSEKDPFWNQLLSYSFRVPHCSSDARLLEESTLHLCKMLAQNNLQSGNLCTLIRVFLKRVAELKTSTQKEDHVFVWQTYNALFIIRSSLKYLLENFSEGRIVQHLSVVVPDAARTAAFLEDGLDGLDMADNESRPVQTLLEEFLHSLLTLLVEVPVLNFSYVLHLEAINTLLIVLSVQMFIPRIAHKSLFFDCMMQGNCAKDAHILVKTLLDHFVKHEECPAELLKPQESSPSFLYGITAAVAAGLWAVLTLGYGSRGHKPEPEDRGLLANQSLLLLMVLTNHYTHDKGVHNPYRIALCMFSNSQDGGTPGALVPPFKTNFANLYDAFCSHLKEDQATLLLYSLLHQNLNFRTYILSKTNIDQLVIPLLKILYYAQDRNFHHIYMALIVLLILSEDDAFNKSVHELVVKNITWYTERNISEITLGGLIVLVSIRTIQYNMTGMRDKYLHTNCLAALANMSSQFHSLHPYVTQRIVSMFESLTKKHDRIVTQLRERATEVQSMEEDPECEILLSDLAVLEDSIRMVLEIINSCLTNMLPHNPHLIYTLLYKCERFSGFKTHAKFYDIIQNIDTVLAYFTQRLEQNEHHNLTVHQVLDIIKQGILQWPRDRLRKFPDLKFKYVEEDQPEEFFIPYVWSLVYHSSNLYWDPDRIELFTLNSS
ncbi:dymeclin-like [Acanthaster planci]|uniref:Dymeclin n=1 Tax=Acanthaster planci TaxID=133434 RepID=A0A8B7Y0D0_ACAPL|nr:dymeclin-like [Acanthaster planci]